MPLHVRQDVRRSEDSKCVGIEHEGQDQKLSLCHCG
jgi:hypothetical protein